MIEKKCNKCHKIKGIDNFNTHPNCKDGYFTICKECQNKSKREREAKKKVIIHPVGNKECHNCKKEKPYKDYQINKVKKDGYSHICKECTKTYRAKYYKKEEIDYASFYLPINNY